MRPWAILTVFALIATGAFAAAEQLELPDGAKLTVMQPDVDGVTRPMAVADDKHMPAYPDLARPLREESNVVFSVVVDETGKALRLELRSASHPGLGFEDNAAKALFDWTFEPATLDGKPVASFTNVRVRFVPPRRDRAVVSGIGMGGNAAAGFTNGSDRYFGAGGALDGRGSTSPATDFKGSAPTGTMPTPASETAPATFSRDGVGKNVSPGQLYFRGHPEWGWKLYGGNPGNPDQR